MHVLGVPSTYCQPKMSFQQLNFRFVWVVVGSRAGWGTLNIGSDCTASTCCSGLTWPTSHQIMPSKYGFHCVFFSYTHVVSKRGVVETHALLWMRVRGNYSIDLPFFSELKDCYAEGDKGKEKNPILSTILISHSCSALILLPCSWIYAFFASGFCC